MNWIHFVTATWILLATDTQCFAQCSTIQFPDDSTAARQARTQVEQLHKAKRLKDYRRATSALTWLARNAPQADSNLYADADLIYSYLLRRERNQTVKRLYLDSMYHFYDLRAANCDPNFDVKSARAMALYRSYISTDPQGVRKQLDSVIRREHQKISDEVLIAYMKSVKAEFDKFEKLTERDVLRFYNTAMDVAEQKRSNVRKSGGSEEEVMRLMDDIDAELFSMVVVDCPFVTKILGPRFRAYPDDLMLGRRIISLMQQSLCIDDPLWLLAAERIYIAQDKSDYSLAKSIGLRYYNDKNYPQARYYLEEAARLAPTGVDKSSMLILVGQIEAHTNKPKARTIFRSALEADKENKEAYERIGDLYFFSENSCGGKEKITPLLVYMLAADYYQRAGNAKKLSAARDKFPTKDNLKAWGYTEGREASVECWIQETTTIRAKN